MTATTDGTPVAADGQPAASESDERRWDRGAWLTLAVAILLIVWPLAMSLMSFRYPTDGWMSSQAQSTFAKGGQYQLIFNLSGRPSELRETDVITAINGRPLLPDALPPVPDDLDFGDTVRYDINRAGEQLVVDAPMQRLDARVFGRLMTHNPLSNLQVLLVAALAIYVFLARPGNHGARYLFIGFAAMLGAQFNAASYSLYRTTFPPGRNFLMDFNSLVWGWCFFPSLTLFVLVYPVRQWPLRRFPRGFPALVYGTFMLLAAVPIALTIANNRPSGQALSLVAVGLMGGSFLAATIGSLAYNLLKVKDPVVRAQIRWIGLGFVVGLALPVAFATIRDLLQLDSPLFQWIDSASGLFIVLLPISFAIGILRYRLFDIDVIIRRTTSYAIITALLALVYLGSIVVLQRLFGDLTGQNSTVAVVLSTLLIAALSLPVRRRVQDLIDRRFNRTRYNAEKTLERFAATARDETDLDALLAELQRVIQETMQPESVSVWLRPTDKADARPKEQASALKTRSQEDWS